MLSHKDAGYARFVNKLNRRAVPGAAGNKVEGIVSSVIADVQKRGNAAVFEYTQRFDGLKLTAKALKLVNDSRQTRATTPPSGTAEIREQRSG